MSLRFTFPPDEYAKPRERMVRDQIERRGVSDPRVLEAMRAVPRHRFLSADDHASAYDDSPLAIGCRQTVSQPYIVAYMTAALALQGGEQVLEIGTGSGYQTAILACLSRKVYSVERIPELADRARETLLALGIDNAEVIAGSSGSAPGSTGALRPADRAHRRARRTGTRTAHARRLRDRTPPIACRRVRAVDWKIRMGQRVTLSSGDPR
jgi:protein-L-isoaspartate(D-aspartate) O-methyltransferase